MAEPTLIGSVQRALRLMEAVAASEDAVPAKSLARMVGLALPTTYHLLRTLVHEGYLRKLTDGYVLGPSAMVASPPAMQALLPRVRPVLKSLRDEVGGATYLSVYSDGEIRLVDIADGPDAPCVDLWVGVQDSGHATAFGKAILAGLSAERRADYIARHQLHDLTPNTITDRPRTSGAGAGWVVIGPSWRVGQVPGADARRPGSYGSASHLDADP